MPRDMVDQQVGFAQKCRILPTCELPLQYRERSGPDATLNFSVVILTIALLSVGIRSLRSRYCNGRFFAF
jgi:hypothetical protein